MFTNDSTLQNHGEKRQERKESSRGDSTRRSSCLPVSFLFQYNTSCYCSRLYKVQILLVSSWKKQLQNTKTSQNTDFLPKLLLLFSLDITNIPSSLFLFFSLMHTHTHTQTNLKCWSEGYTMSYFRFCFTLLSIRTLNTVGKNIWMNLSVNIM